MVWKHCAVLSKLELSKYKKEIYLPETFVFFQIFTVVDGKTSESDSES
jgi:hypothetical protein